MSETLPKPAGIAAAEWEAMCGDVVRVPAMYRYAKNAYLVFDRARAAGYGEQARPILLALMDYLDALGGFVSKVSDGMLEGVRAGTLPGETLSRWLSDVQAEARAFSDAMGGRGLGFVPLVLGLVALVLAGLAAISWAALYEWRKLNERKAALDAALASYSALRLPLPPAVVNPPASPWVSVDAGGAVSVGALAALGVLVYLVTKRGR
jgi:hypothetical protein